MHARALVVLPTYNEAENVLAITRAVLAVDATLEVLVVDDASPDGTGDLVERERAQEPRLALLRRAGKLGLGTAYLAGFRFGLERGYDFVLTMDCDGSHHPRYLPALLAALKDHDMVIGSRYVPGGGIANWPWSRRALSSFANLYARAAAAPAGARLHLRLSRLHARRCSRRWIPSRSAPPATRSSRRWRGA